MLNEIRFYRYIVSLGIAGNELVTVKNKWIYSTLDEIIRKGWWQKLEVYRFRKDLIDM